MDARTSATASARVARRISTLRSRRHPFDGRSDQAGDGRSRGVVRRSGILRCADARPSQRGLQRDASHADRRHGVGSVAAGLTGWAGTRGAALRHRRERQRTARRRQRPSRDGEPCARGRHVPPRCGRPVGQHRRGDAIGGLADQFAGDSRARFSSRHPRADVLVARRTGLVVAPRFSTAHHAHAVDRARSRRCPHGVRHAGRRQSRPVVPAVLRQCGRSRDGSASGDRRALFQTNHAPDSFYPRRAEPLRLLAEDRFPAATLADLARRGHHVVSAGAWTLGRNCAARLDAGGTTVRAAASARHQQAYALGR